MPVPALAQDEQVYQLFISGSPVEAVALSPDGLKAAAASGDFVTIWDIRDGGPSFDAALPGDEPAGIAWSPDGEYISIAGARRGLFGGRLIVTVWHVPTQRRVMLTHAAAPLHDLRFSPDGNLLIASARHKLYVWNALSGVRLCRPTRNLLAGSQNDVLHLNWQGDQPLLLLQERLADADRLSLWNALAGQQTWAAEQPLGYYVTWSPGGNHLALWPGGDAIESSALVMDAATGNTLFTLQGTGPVAWSPDGRYLAIAAEDRRLSVYEVQTGDELFSFALVESPVRAVSWSRTGRYLTLAHEDDSFFVWQVAP